MLPNSPEDSFLREFQNKCPWPESSEPEYSATAETLKYSSNTIALIPSLVHILSGF